MGPKKIVVLIACAFIASGSYSKEIRSDNLVFHKQIFPQILPDKVVEDIKKDSEFTLILQFNQNEKQRDQIFKIQSQDNEKYFQISAENKLLDFELKNEENKIISKHYPLNPKQINTIAITAKPNSITIYANGRKLETKQYQKDVWKEFIQDPKVDQIFLVPEQDKNFEGQISNIQIFNKALDEEKIIEYTKSTQNKDEKIVQPFVQGDDTNSQYFRIPSILSLKNSDLMAIADARFAGLSDSANNLDTAIRFKRNGQWQKAEILNHFEDYSDNVGFSPNSASFIDSSAVEDEQGRIYVITDLFPSNGGLSSAGKSVEHSGMFTKDNQNYIALTTSDQEDISTFEYYLKPTKDKDFPYEIVRQVDDEPTNYKVNAYFQIFEGDKALTILQKNSDESLSGKEVPMLIFYEGAKFKTLKTSFIVLRTSDDNGHTWSAPRIIDNTFKNQGRKFLGVGPGHGLEIKNGKYKGRIIFPLYLHSEGYERSLTIYSDDRGETWKKGETTSLSEIDSPGKSSEAQLVELPDGSIRMYARGFSNFIGYADSTDGGVSFSPIKEDRNLLYGGNVMVSFINYSKKIDQKPVILALYPEGLPPREGLSRRYNGVLRVGLVEEANERYKVNWKYSYRVNNGQFGYSSLTELSNGKIAMLYETNSDGKFDPNLDGDSILKYQELDLREIEGLQIDQ